MYCVAIDPGQTTGLAIVGSEFTPWDVDVLQVGPNPHHGRLLRHLQLWNPEVVVCESFENRGQDSAVLVSAEYIGVVKAYVHEVQRCVLVLQNKATGCTFWDDHKLKAYDMYAVGLRHARDATRHYLYWRTFKLGDQSLLKREATGYVCKYTR